RVMDCGDAGYILLSKHVADDLKQYPQWRSYLHELGECEVKHGVRVSVVNLYTDELGNPELPEKFSRLPTVEAAVSAAKKKGRQTSGRKYFLIAVLAIVAVAPAAGFYIFLHPSSSKPPPSSTAPALPAIQEKL